MRRITARKRDERGSAELIVTLFMLPLALFLILALIDVSLYMSTRSSVQNALQDGTRQVAAWGGQDTRLNTYPGRQAVSSVIRDTLYKDGNCTYSRCTAPPVVSCDPAPGQVVANAGRPVSCTVRYSYASVTGGGFLLGFEQIFNEPFTVKETSYSSVGFN